MAGCASAKKQGNNGPQQVAPATAVAQSSKSVEPKGTEDFRVTSCAKGNEIRLLEVQNKGAGCILDYTKSGKVSAVASSAHGIKHCVSTKSKIQTKLKKAGYSCA